jgi:hypothetical protein
MSEGMNLLDIVVGSQALEGYERFPLEKALDAVSGKNGIKTAGITGVAHQ